MGHQNWITNRATPVKFTYFKSKHEPELMVDLTVPTGFKQGDQ